jgi:DNA-binding transcriptional LysR family regulator
MTVCLYVFPSLLGELRRVHPQLELKITGGTGDKAIADLRSGIVDLGLLTLPIDVPDLVGVPVVQEELLLVTEPKHPLARQKRIVPADLTRQPFILFESGSNTRRVIDEFFLREHVEPRIVMETENVEIIKAMVHTGLGIGIIPYLAVAAEVVNRQLFCTRIAGQELFRETGWVYPKMSRLPRTVSEVLKAFDVIRPKLRFAPKTKGST